MKNIIQTYIEHNGGLAAATQALNLATSQNYQPHRLGEWRDGKRAMPEIAHRAMLESCLLPTLTSHGIETQLNPISLTTQLMPPARLP